MILYHTFETMSYLFFSILAMSTYIAIMHKMYFYSSFLSRVSETTLYYYYIVFVYFFQSAIYSFFHFRQNSQITEPLFTILSCILEYLHLLLYIILIPFSSITFSNPLLIICLHFLNTDKRKKNLFSLLSVHSLSSQMFRKILHSLAHRLQKPLQQINPTYGKLFHKIIRFLRFLPKCLVLCL